MTAKVVVFKCFAVTGDRPSPQNLLFTGGCSRKILPVGVVCRE